MKWTVSAILVLLTALCLPGEFAAMGSAPTHDPVTETVQTPDTRALVAQTGAQDKALPTRTESGQSALKAEQETADSMPQEQPVLAQAEAQPVWRQGTGSDTRTAQTPGPTSTAQPAWRQGTQSPSESAEGEKPSPDIKAGGPKRLFRSTAFRGNFKALPKWQRVLSKVKGQIQTLNSCTSAKTCPPGATSWKRIMQQAKGLRGMEQLKTVNSFFNKWPYRLDQDAYGTSDWWATPQEFLKISGDCEDYAIIKYFALRELGYSKDDLRIVVVKDRIRGIGHAVLAVFLQGEAHILNNISDAIFTDIKYRHYTPQYSLNEEHRWSHIPVAN